MKAPQYRALLDAMMRELGDRTGFSFVKLNPDTDQAEVRKCGHVCGRACVLGSCCCCCCCCCCCSISSS